ncbi:glycoside hydrolase family 38 protein [Hyaloscypha variabilis F]|uniref:Alpha-mannosidase n=1 Tax=Hyaloscypha variabilis (strain UAMH 11265 / GT02V1 / F) TaxID=1149755 RepID=A0A2J6R1T3_HYAVF|nr:glycoside hydrolase family 38 protein [Hyaloscypha variabilis F]
MCSHGSAAMNGHEHSSLAPYPLRAQAPVGKRITSLYKKRLDNFFTPGQWEKVNLLAALKDGVYSGPENIKLAVWHATGTTRPTFKEATEKSNPYKETQTGENFGPSWTTHWFRASLTVPKELCQEDTPVELHWDCDNEATVWSEKGEPLQGLTGRGERVEWILPKAFKDGKEHILYIEMACNGMFGNGPGRPIFKNNAGGDSIQPPDENKHFKLSKAELVAPNMQARMLSVDFQIIHDAAVELSEDSWEQHEALNVASRIIDTFNASDKTSILRCRKIAEEYLGSEINSERVYGSIEDKKPTVYAIGHCHIDTCWLWPWAETRRKVVRSWSNQCDLMDRYPELNFACSQAQQFKWLKEDYPYAWERVKSKIKSGQFHPIGGCWIEHDTNLPGGESLVRQFLYGQRFFEANFGTRSTTCWLPDSFGFSSQLPQLCRQAGMTRFLTQKPCFNSVNDFPHTTFNWVALDGSQVICHMPPCKTYCSEASFGDIKRSITNHKSLDQDNTALVAFGKGDGGGGPTWQHMERLRRIRGMANTVGQVPRVHSGGAVDDFFNNLEKKASSLVTWYGELYFELHRGVYTTQASQKSNNRRSEFLLRDIELLATIASIQDSSYRYPKKELDEMWEGVLLCQFHDCLPGSAIKMCYDDSNEIYANVFQTGYNLLQTIYPVLGISEVRTESISSLENTLALNTLPWPRQEIIAGSENQAVIAHGSSNLLSVAEFGTSQTEKLVTIEESTTGVFVLQNSQLSVTVEDGCIISLYDRKAKREVLSGRANKFVIFDDQPIYWQAWDVEVYHLETRQELRATTTSILEDKPYRVSVLTETKISELSSIRSTITLSAAFDGQQSYVECAADINWHETMKFLKVEFPVDVRNTEASYETQFGIIKRPTHYNTSWDMAKFEVCCHKFADLSEYNYGVSILNDSKYGFATVGNVMRLSLLRSPKAPDDTADMGHHSIRWAIMPHQGELGAETVRAAFNFNNPLKLVNVTRQSCLSVFPIVLRGDENLVLDTVKRGEDDGDMSTDELPRREGRSVVIRVYDALGGRGRGVVETTWSVSKVFKTNLLEDDGEEVPFGDGRFEVDLGPFQVATYRLVLA